MSAPDLMFFRELRVSDPILKDDASTSTYTFVDQRGRKHPLKLHYKFPAPLYADASDVMRNQARVHHAIPSLNYGLFCEKVVFEFALTKADLEYLREMQAITAREIYLNRFVGDTPHKLILPEYHVPTARFEPRALKRLAKIEAPLAAEPAPLPEAAAPDPRRYAVLSSGGKESLLTYGILRELNEDVSPIYVNESGRHWYTALMAHRHHEKTEDRTKRIWTSVDRLYVGANRLLPCVRKDFHRLAADVYPTQLFTFNSYQMAVAGLSMHFGIGTMLMGNEFDEGDWPEEKGVRHWWGIYDQSQVFDDRLNAYFEKKRWGIRQASILRTLSGVTIQDLLATRYPDLAAVQTSCHATTIKNGRVLPCGRCSKCQGIILFLLAAGHDPRILRYRKADVDALAVALAQTHVKFERPEAEHCMWLAQKQGWKFQGSANGFVPQPHPEVQAMRFHPETSPPRAMPKELADRVYPILRTKTGGALAKRGDAWVPTSV